MKYCHVPWQYGAEGTGGTDIYLCLHQQCHKTLKWQKVWPVTLNKRLCGCDNMERQGGRELRKEEGEG